MVLQICRSEWVSDRMDFGPDTVGLPCVMAI